MQVKKISSDSGAGAAYHLYYLRCAWKELSWNGKGNVIERKHNNIYITIRWLPSDTIKDSSMQHITNECKKGRIPIDKLQINDIVELDKCEEYKYRSITF